MHYNVEDNCVEKRKPVALRADRGYRLFLKEKEGVQGEMWISELTHVKRADILATIAFHPVR